MSVETLENQTIKILDVPYYSEFTEIDGSLEHKDFFKRRSCGIVSVKMILDYFHVQSGNSKVRLSDLVKKSLQHRAYLPENAGTKANGWTHAGMVRVLEAYGYRAWRRRFFILADDLALFRKEGVNKESMKSYVSQVLNEAFTTFERSIDNGNPVMISILKNLGTKRSPHIVVLTGYHREDSKLKGFYINDPNNPKKGKGRPIHKNQFISVSDFVKIWRKTAIFVENE